MKVKVSVSVGELIDKITILEIKKEKIADESKLILVEAELKELNGSLGELDISKDVLNIKNDLKNINLELWEIEDLIRDEERNKRFGQEFVDLARRVYITNDKRFKAKDEINSLLGSNLKEVKSYQDY